MTKYWVEQVRTCDDVLFAVFTFEGEGTRQVTSAASSLAYAQMQADCLQTGKPLPIGKVTSWDYNVLTGLWSMFINDEKIDEFTDEEKRKLIKVIIALSN